ncbi:MAG: helix-turn-helix transcriptional regulator, partial [Gemmatimonadaceae bacterium]
MASIAQLSVLVRAARTRAGLTQLEAARRVGVSHRLWAEVEQGRRPNVSFSTMMRMLNEVGMRVTVSSPALDRAARAAKRRATWVGAQLRLGDDDDAEPTAPARHSDRLGAVAA